MYVKRRSTKLMEGLTEINYKEWVRVLILDFLSRRMDKQAGTLLGNSFKVLREVASSKWLRANSHGLHPKFSEQMEGKCKSTKKPIWKTSARITHAAILVSILFAENHA